MLVMKIPTILLLLSLMPIHRAFAITAPPTIDLGPDLNADEYLNASSMVGPTVDLYQKQLELTKIRTQVNPDEIDKCYTDNSPHDQFADQISYYSQMMIKDIPSMIGFIGSTYKTSSNDADLFPTSLIRHPLCAVSKSTLSKTMKKVPAQRTIDMLNVFATTVNKLRTSVLNGDQKAKAELLFIWSRFFSCLAYTESLSTADNSTSQSVAALYSPTGYRRPAGVEFYEDAAQPPVSRLNVGTYQFTPDKTGNIIPCIKAWNSLHTGTQSCSIPVNATQGELIKILGSSLQSFNAFCGVHKLIETFSVQVNTTNSGATHPSNFVDGKLKPAELRCVSPHFQAGKAYNHFGPFQNSTGSNMEALFSCSLRSQN